MEKSEWAEKIATLADRSNVPLLQDPLLTDLVSQVPKEGDIPENLYILLAEVLSYLHRVDETIDSDK